MTTITAQRRRAPLSNLAARFGLALFLAVSCAACGTAPAQQPPPSKSASAAPAAPWKVPTPGALENVITQITAMIMPRAHYERLPLDEQMSARIFDAYFDRLDHDRSFFLASDLAEFAPYRDRLGDMIGQGRCDFAYRVYERFIQRVQERVAFTHEYLKQKPDFSTDETLQIDRSKAPWCADREALDALWRLRVKNQLLTYSLGDKMQAKKDAEAKKKTKKDPEAAKKLAAKLPAKPPQERVGLFYDRLLTSLQENDKIDILEIFLNSVTQTYDPHSDYMAPDSEEEFDMLMKLSLKGIGAVLQSEDGYVKISEVMPGGPAALDGRIHDGDWIVAVGQEGGELVDIVNMPLRKVVRMIRGEKGTKVQLGIIGGGKNLGGVPDVVVLTRDEIKLTEQEAKSEYMDIPGTAGAGGKPLKAAVINLPGFYEDFEGKQKDPENYKSASRDVRRLLDQAKANGAAGVILDLRFDGGGSLDEAVKIAGMFIQPGPVVQVRDANRQVKVLSSEDAPVCEAPLIVLINRMSASASEIVAAALQDYHRAIIIGDASSHGKGTVQTVFRLENALRRNGSAPKQDPGSVKFTIAKFYRVNGGSTQIKGVSSDIAFPSFTDHMELGESRLPNALPWDEITNLNPGPCRDVRPLLPKLQELSRKRVAENKEFQVLFDAVRHFGELRGMKELPLNKAKREKIQGDEEAFAKHIDEMIASANKATGKKTAAKDGDEPESRDLVLEEAVRVLGDEIRLQAEAAKPVVAGK